MKIDLKIKGQKELEAALKKSALNIFDRSMEGIQEEGREIFEESQEEVPEATGALKGSGFIETEGRKVIIGYGRSDQPGASGKVPKQYMVAVHERLDTYHPKGKAKFLEDPVNRHKANGAESIAEKIRRKLHL